MKNVRNWLAFGFLLAVILVFSGAANIAEAADGWQAANNNNFGQGGVIGATKFTSWNNQLWVGTQNSSGTATVRTTSGNFFSNTDSLSPYSAGKNIAAFQQFYESSNDHGVGQTIFVADGNRVLFEDPVTQQWVDTNLPQVNGNGTLYHPEITDLVVFNNYIYASTRAAHSEGAVIFRHSTDFNQDWETVVSNGYNNGGNAFVNKLFAFNGYIYAQFSSDAFGGLNCSAYVRSTDGTTWTLVNPTGGFDPQSCIGAVHEFQDAQNHTYLAVGIDTNVQGNGQYSTLLRTYDGVNYQWTTGGPSDPYAIDPPWLSHNPPFTQKISAILPFGNNQWLLGTPQGSVLRACVLTNQSRFFLTSYHAITTDHDRVNDLGFWNGDYYASLGQGSYGDQGGNVQTGIGKVVRITPTSLDQFQDNQCAYDNSQPSSLDIFLPSKEILTPDQLKVASNTFTFNTNSEQFSPATQGGFTITTTKEGSDRNTYYHIKIDGFQKGGSGLASNLLRRTVALVSNSVKTYAFSPPPATTVFLLQPSPTYSYKLTFKKPLSTGAVDSYASFLRDTGNNNSDQAFVGDQNCTLNGNGQYLCLKTKVQMTTAETGVVGPQYIMQALPITAPGTIEIQGNVAASGQISGFSFSNTSNSIAIGGSIPTDIPNASKDLRNYIDQNATKFSWQNVQPQLTALFNKRTKGATTNGSLSGSNWNLNAVGTDPSVSSTSSFSTPPEGKLWNINGPLTLGNVHFAGSGTIAVQNDVTFNGTVTCDANTRLGIIAGGSITFKNPTINCGAYTALGGNVKFDFTVTSNNSANGIYVAQSSVDLPSVNLGINYRMGYDKYFGANPTVLYQDLLNVVFGSQ